MNDVSAALVNSVDRRVQGDVTPRELLLRYESLGGHGHGCEFGLAQRHFGAEPLGLLRWADLDVDCLAGALERGFEGVGDPEYTEIFPHDHEEYWTRDKRFHMAMRTFIKVSEVPYNEMVTRVSARLKFLRAKLIEDLQTGRKVFVYKDMFRNLSDDELARLRTAMRKYGENWLLYLRYADAEHPAGAASRVQPGLIVGNMAHFAFSPENTLIGPSDHLFLEVCRSAIDIVATATDKPHSVPRGTS